MKKLATAALIAAGTLGLSTAAFAEGCNWGAKASMVTADADHSPVPAKPVVAEVTAPDTTTSDAPVQTAQAPQTTMTE